MSPIPDRMKKVVAERRRRAKDLIEQYNSKKPDTGEVPPVTPAPNNPEDYRPPKPDPNPRNRRNP